MHERSLARHILKQIHEMSVDYPHQRVKQVELEVGAMAGVESSLLASALSEEQGDEHAEIHFLIQTVGLQAFCPNCQKSFEIDNFSFICPVCGTPDIEMTQGESVRIMTLTLEDVSS